MAATFLKYTSDLREEVEARLLQAKISRQSWDKLKALLVDLGPYIWSGRSWHTNLTEVCETINRNRTSVVQGLKQLDEAGIIEKRSRGRRGLVLRYLLVDEA